MIDINKKYRTKDGRKVRIYATDGAGGLLVHGAVKGSEGWSIMKWASYGSVYRQSQSPADLVEVVMFPEYWVVWNEGDLLPFAVLRQPKSLENRTIIHHPAQEKPVT
jgi:hypothetical protein|tara:strand:+ start:925 stop:1245 length:321 start_codon:yes stop_codon:yes gene_type:complete